MKLDTPYERIQDLIGLLELDPSINQIVVHLSKQLDPLGELTGIGWMTLGDDGFLRYDVLHGFHISMDPEVKVSITDDNPACKALRSGRSVLVNMRSLYSDYQDATHETVLNVYSAGAALPLNERIVIGCAYSSPYEALQEYESYFECIRLVLSLWVNKVKFGATALSNKSDFTDADLTSRQERILAMIKEGATNGAIGLLLGFSESLIRQETIIIYRKLGVDGRRELVGNDHHQTFTLRGED